MCDPRIKDMGVLVFRTQAELEALPDYDDLREYLIAGNDPHDMCAWLLQLLDKHDIEVIRRDIYRETGSAYNNIPLKR